MGEKINEEHSIYALKSRKTVNEEYVLQSKLEKTCCIIFDI